MARPRPPRDRETAPGDEPGAESFSRPGRPAGEGIVRLSDLFAPEDFAAPSPGSPPARKKDAATAVRGSARAGSAVPDTEGGTRVVRGGRRSLPRDAGTTGGAAPELADRAAVRPGVDAPAAVQVDSGGEADPAYQSLFGNEGDTRRRPKRERKPATALQRALGLLTRREHSRKELTRKLVSRGVDAAEVEAAVDKLSGAGWQDDRRFAESLVRSRATNGYGPLHIRAELGTHDLPAEVRQNALDEFDGDWTEIARDLVARRFSRIEDRRLRERKAGDYLMRRGFPSDVIRAAVRSTTDD